LMQARTGSGRLTSSEQADLIVLMVSANFMASWLLLTMELMRALARHQVGAAIVIPLVVRLVGF
jgi:hypothetical protein